MYNHSSEKNLLGLQKKTRLGRLIPENMGYLLINRNRSCAID
jgi:hypothetical protein